MIRNMIIAVGSAFVVIAVFLGLFFFTDLFSPSAGGDGGDAGTVISDNALMIFEGSVRVNQPREFLFYATHTGIWEFMTSDNGGSDPFLSVFCVLNGHIKSDDDGGEGLNSYVSVFLEGGREYTVTASFTGSAPDGYMLTVSYGPRSALFPGGMIRDDVRIRNVPVSHILDSHPENNGLGTLTRSEGPFFSYDGVELYFINDYVSNISVFDMNLLMVNAVTLNMTREQLIAFLGEPLEFFVYEDYPEHPFDASDDDRILRYHVSTYLSEYVVDFWFYEPDAGGITDVVAFQPYGGRG